MVGNQARSVPGGGAVDSGERWISTDTWCFVTFALGFLLEAYIFGMAAIATGWVKMPTSLRSRLRTRTPPLRLGAAGKGGAQHSVRL